MKLGNKGISIIELMLSMVLFSIVALSVTFFISTSSKTCNKAEELIKLQEEAQVVTNQLINFSQEGNCVEVVKDATSGDVRYAVYNLDKSNGNAKNEIIIYYKKSSEKLYYYEVTDAATDDEKNAILSEIRGTSDVTIGQLMGECIKELSINDVDNWITFDVTYGSGKYTDSSGAAPTEKPSQTVNASESIKLRNKQVVLQMPIIRIGD